LRGFFILAFAAFDVERSVYGNLFCSSKKAAERVAGSLF